MEDISRQGLVVKVLSLRQLRDTSFKATLYSVAYDVISSAVLTIRQQNLAILQPLLSEILKIRAVHSTCIG